MKQFNLKKHMNSVKQLTVSPFQESGYNVTVVCYFMLITGRTYQH